MQMIQFYPDWHARDTISWAKSDWKGSIWELVHAYNCTQNSTTGFSPYYLIYGRQPHLPIVVTLRLAPNLVTTPSSSKYVQNLRESIRWAHRKTDLCQQKETWCHEQNSNKCSRAVALKAGDTVLVHVTTFKGWYKIQNKWENREYVVEQWPYPNLPVYVVHTRDGEGHSQTLHRNYPLPISNNLEQVGDENSVAGVGPKDEPTPTPQMPSESLANSLAKCQPESLPDSLPNQHKLVDPEVTWEASWDLAIEGSKAGPDQPPPPRQSACTMRNQLPWRYWNFILQ